MRTMTTLLVAGTLALTGCALSPQTVRIEPTPHVTVETIGHNHVIGLQVRDARADKSIGTRGGVYAQSSLIRADNDIGAAMHKAMEQGLFAQSYRVANDIATAETVLSVELEQLSYVVPEGAVTTSADISTTVRITAERGNDKHTASYRSTITRKFPVAPTATQNETWINDVLSETLARFFVDPKMRAFLTQ